MEFKHNTDLNPDKAYVNTYTSIRPLLVNPSAVHKFGALDAEALDAYRLFVQIGSAALVLAVCSLVALTWKLFLAAIDLHSSPILAWGAEIAALLSVFLTLSPAMVRARARWLDARYAAERVRQWHFQSWLDGQLVALAASDIEAFERERTLRWERFVQHARGAEGARESFVDAEQDSPWHEYSALRGTTTDVGDELFRAYSELRIEWQKHYFKLKREAFCRSDEWTEALARWSLFTAVLLAAVELVLLAIESPPELGSHSTTLAITAVAITLAVISTGVRVYRSALGVREEKERYEAKWTRLLLLEESFKATTKAAERSRVMQEVERAEVEELREFLRLRRRSTFLL